MLSRLGSPALPWETVLTVFIAHLPSTASERISSRRNVTTEKCFSLLYYRLCFICLWIYVFVCSVNAAVKKKKKKWGEISSFRWPWNTVWVEELILLYLFQLKLFFCCCSQVFTCWCSQWSPNGFCFFSPI